jgi:carbonic anhydrase/acetyltransferase-like protein (isoleucine patch superfamily)
MGAFIFTNMTKKYELTDEVKCLDNNITLHRIKALRDFGNVKAGDLGGYIESEDNLSQWGLSWVGDAACVYANARVRTSAVVSGDAHVFGKASVQGSAHVFENAKVCGDAVVEGCCQIYGCAKIQDDAWITDSAHVYDNAEVSGSAWARDCAEIQGDAIVTGSSYVGGIAAIGGDVTLVSGQIVGKACVFNNHEHCGFDCFGSENRHTHAYITSDNSIEITCGCFTGTIDEFEAAVHKTHAGNRCEKEYMAIIEVIKIKFKHD